MTTAPQLDWPTGGLVWTDQRRGKLPIIRGIRAPAPYVPDDCLSHPPAFHDLQPYELQKVQDCWTRLAAALDIQGAPWTQAEAAARLAAERLRNPDPAYWREVFAQCGARQPESWQQRPELVWAIRAASVAHSLAFATRITLETGPDLFHDRGYTEHSYHGLRHALVAAPEADHRAALETAAEFRGRSRLLDRMVSFLFPEQRAWAEECVEPGASINQSWWLDETAMSVAAACRHFRDRYFGASHAYEVSLLYIHLYGEEAALPVIGIALDSQDTKQQREWFIDFVLRINVPGVLPLLMARLDNREVHAKLDQLTEQWPAALLKCAIDRAAATGNSLVESWAVALALRLPDTVAPALSVCSEAGRDYFAGLLATRTHATEAPAEALPGLLRDPPWVNRIQAIPTLALAPIERPDAMVWQDGQRDEWAKPPIDRTHWLIRNQPSGEPDPLYALRLIGIKKTAFDLAMAGGPLGTGDLLAPSWQLHRYPALLSLLPDPAALGLWNTLPATFWRDAWGMRTLIARFQLDCVPGLLGFIPTNTETGLELALPIRSSRLAPIAADAWKRLKKARPHAEAWLLAHAETAIAALIPPAFGKDRVPRETAQATLRWLAEQGFEADLRRIVARYGEAAAQAMELLLRADPALMVPARMPKLPAFFTPTAFRRPILATGGALSLAAVEHVARMLTLSPLDAPYVGLNAVKAACTRESLAAFAWDVFEAWLVAGAPPKENWAYHVLGWFGDDATARRLTEKIRVWPTHAALARAIVGLDILATIGTDGALRELHGIAQKVKSKPLQEKARQKITQVAEILDLTAEELADRLVPDLGLDGQGKAVLDFGSRRFVVEFDEALKPRVKDEAGQCLKDLPKPNQKDDAALAKAAVERFKAIKKEAKAIAGQQVARLEQAMVGRRRWSLELFRQLFVEHPLMRHLAKRLLWGVYRDGPLVDAFRVAEDLTLADRRDEAYSLPAEAMVGLAHALELPDDLARDFGQIFGDYEIVQPFKQLGRETYALGEAERGADMIDRFRDKAVATGSILGLAKQGWEQGEADGAYVFSVAKRLPGDLEAELALEPGYHLGEIAATPAQALSEIRVHRLGDRCTGRRLKMAELDAILVSELLRDMELLAAFKA